MLFVELALKLFREALEYYDKGLAMIKMGGLSKDKETEYIMIRDTHIELLSILEGDKSGHKSQIEREYIVSIIKQSIYTSIFMTG